ncbi:hypothetical protein [Kitasatospora cineracea]|uniref:hypothetical protein n=1 Tax=Kitasatospora cineracea TaxID=88074 RepID=UPI0038076B89
MNATPVDATSTPRRPAASAIAVTGSTHGFDHHRPCLRRSGPLAVDGISLLPLPSREFFR